MFLPRVRLQSKETINKKDFRMPIVKVRRGANVEITHPNLVNLFECCIGEGTRIGPFVDIQKNAQIGAWCDVRCHARICEGGEFSEAAYFVLSGRCELRRRQPDGTEEVFDRLEPGDTFGALDEIRPDDAGTSAVAATDSVVYWAASSWISGLSRMPATPVMARAMIHASAPKRVVLIPTPSANGGRSTTARADSPKRDFSTRTTSTMMHAAAPRTAAIWSRVVLNIPQE